MKLYQLYDYIKWSVWVNWYVGQLWAQSFIEHANTALLYVSKYLWRRRSWQLKTQATSNRDTKDNLTYYYNTMFPIIDGTSVKFFCSDVEQIVKTDPCEFQCWCVDHISLECCQCDCDCDTMLDMTYVDPWTPLRQWQFTIMWWSFWWGNLWNKIKAKFPCSDCCCKWGTIFISYYAWPRMFKCLSDDIPMPDEYIEAFKLILKWLLSTNIRNGQSNKETLWFTFAKEIIEGLDYTENNIPTQIQWKR